ncbi:PiggyBac transposable element-derived protein 1 [Elysia marginata]|uniref:PiggyBac transposable element-derived protein 1 n=1 Tax=Elysia marginata TaxID=1093978 RepID=A0AAV4HX96_9GAST|nr:PiggyBac transposable element-derived protein 1 [Elysia marginata]
MTLTSQRDLDLIRDIAKNRHEWRTFIAEVRRGAAEAVRSHDSTDTINTPDGYLVQTKPYQGAGTVHTQPDLGIGGSVVMNLISVLPEEDKYCLCFDNLSLFTSPAITDKGCDATGTLHANRLNQCLLEGVDSMKEMKRGSMDHRLNSAENIILLHWNDNSVVTLGSTKHGISPLKKCAEIFSVRQEAHPSPLPECCQ